jgi:hypothetical protein
MSWEKGICLEYKIDVNEPFCVVDHCKNRAESGLYVDMAPLPDPVSSFWLICLRFGILKRA